MKTYFSLIFFLISLMAFAQPPSLSPQMIRQVSNSIFTIYTYGPDGKNNGAGSGFVIGSTGLCVTNFHVLEDAFYAEVKMKNGERIKVRNVVDFNANADLVKFRLDVPSGRTFVPLKVSNRLPMQGDDVVNISTPLGVFEQTLSKGNVATVRKHQDHGYLIQVTAPFSIGSSGSPIINMRGEVIGVATMIARFGQSLNFAVSSIKLLQMPRTLNLLLADMSKDPLVTRYIKQARAALKLDNSDKAISMTQTELRRNPQNSIAWSLLGQIYLESGDYENSSKYYQRAYKISNKTEDALDYGLSVAELGMARGGDMRCFRFSYNLFNNVVKDNQHPLIYYYIGAWLYEYTVTYKQLSRNHLQMALEALDVSLNLEQYYFTFAKRGAVKAAMNDAGGALVDYDNAIKLNSQYYEPYYLRGKLRSFNFGNLEAGLEDSEKALRLVGNSPKIRADILYTQAQIYQRLAANTGNGSFTATALHKLDEAYQLTHNNEYLNYKQQLEKGNSNKSNSSSTYRDQGDDFYFDDNFTLQ